MLENPELMQQWTKIFDRPIDDILTIAREIIDIGIPFEPGDMSTNIRLALKHFRINPASTMYASFAISFLRALIVGRNPFEDARKILETIMHKTAPNVSGNEFERSQGLYVEQMRNGMRIIFEGAYFITAAETIMEENNPDGRGPIIARVIDDATIEFIDTSKLPTTGEAILVFNWNVAAAIAAYNAGYLFEYNPYVLEPIVDIPVAQEDTLLMIDTIARKIYADKKIGAAEIGDEVFTATGDHGRVGFIRVTVWSIFMYFFQLPTIPTGDPPTISERNLKYAAINTSNLGIKSSPDGAYEIIDLMKKHLKLP